MREYLDKILAHFATDEELLIEQLFSILEEDEAINLLQIIADKYDITLDEDELEDFSFDDDFSTDVDEE